MKSKLPVVILSLVVVASAAYFSIRYFHLNSPATQQQQAALPQQPAVLLDATSPNSAPGAPRVPVAVNEQIEAAVYHATLSHEKPLITSVAEGSFTPNATNQQVYSVVQPSAANPLNPPSFFAIYINGQVKLSIDQYRATILHTVRMPEADVDYLVVNSEGGQQGETRRYTRVLSLRDLESARVVADVGLTYIDECASGAPDSRIVAAKVDYRPAGTSMDVLPFDQYTASCDSPTTFRFVKQTRDDAEKVLLSLTTPANNQQAPDPPSPAHQSTDRVAIASDQADSSDQSSDPDVGSMNCYTQHQFADLAHQNAQTRAEFAKSLQGAADQKLGAGQVAVKTGLDGNQLLLFAALRTNEQYVETIALNMSTPKKKTQLCVLGFAKVEFRVMDGPRDNRLVGGYSTDAYESMTWMKAHPNN